MSDQEITGDAPLLCVVPRDTGWDTAPPHPHKMTLHADTRHFLHESNFRRKTNDPRKEMVSWMKMIRKCQRKNLWNS